MRLLSLIGGAVGAGLAVWLMHRFGLSHVLALLRATGWGLALIIVAHLAQMLLSAVGWRAISRGNGPAGKPSLPTYFVLRWIREAVSNLLPVAQIGGEVVAVRLLARRHMSLVAATACTVCDLTVELVTQILFTVLGLVTLLALLGPSRVTEAVVSGLGVACLAALAFVAVQWLGLFGRMERVLARLARRFGWAGMTELQGLDQAITDQYRAPRGVALAVCAHFAAWLLGSAEIWIALRALGHHCGVVEAGVIESLSQAVKAASFAVPASIGVLEGGFVVVGMLFGLSPQRAIALALLKRLREIALGLPALAAWQWLESGSAARPDRRPVGRPS